MSETLPTFRHHPDPLATGSVERSDVTCAVCSRQRGFIYKGYVFSDPPLDDSVCPWCIADGSAHERFAAQFADEDYVGGRNWSAVSPEIARIVATRTPSFMPWQTVYWFACCGDAGAYLGRAGHAEIVATYPDAERALRVEIEMTGAEHEDAWQDYFATLDKEDSPTAYLFRCIQCGAIGGFSDSH